MASTKVSNGVILERIDGLTTLTTERFDHIQDTVGDVMTEVQLHHDVIFGKEGDMGLKMRVKRIEDVALLSLRIVAVVLTAAAVYLVNVSFLHIGIK